MPAAQMADTIKTKTQIIAETHAATINDMIEKFESNPENTHIQAMGASLRKFLIDVGLAVLGEHIHHAAVGPHVDNRETEMLIPVSVHDLLRKISMKGWSWIETQLALCCGIPPGPLGEAWRDKCKELARKADGLLAPYESELLTHVTAAGSHTTAVLRLVDYCEHNNVAVCPGKEFEPLSINGYLSKQRILEKCPSMKEALEKGLAYTHIRWEIVVLCPALMRILSEADNAKHTVYNKETPLQTMFHIHRRAIERNAKTDEEWADIAKTCSRGLGSDNATAIVDQALFVKSCSGGVDKPFLIEFNEYYKTLRVQRDLPSDFLRDVSKVKAMHCPLHVVGLVKSSMNAPERFVFGGKVKLFTTADLNSINNKNSSKVLQAHALQVEFRDLGAKLGVTLTSAWHRHLGATDGRFCMHVHDKKAPNRKAFKSLTAIAIEGYNDLKEELGEGFSAQFRNAPCPWAMITIAEAEPPLSTASSAGLRELNVRGEVSQETLSRDLGMTVGKHIIGPEKIEPRKYTVMSYTAEGVGLTCRRDIGKEQWVVPFADLALFIVDNQAVEDLGKLIHRNLYSSRVTRVQIAPVYGPTMGPCVCTHYKPIVMILYFSVGPICLSQNGYRIIVGPLWTHYRPIFFLKICELFIWSVVVYASTERSSLMWCQTPRKQRNSNRVSGSTRSVPLFRQRSTTRRW